VERVHDGFARKKRMTAPSVRTERLFAPPFHEGAIQE
jgi:hypothetical protein